MQIHHIISMHATNTSLAHLKERSIGFTDAMGTLPMKFRVFTLQFQLDDPWRLLLFNHKCNNFDTITNCKFLLKHTALIKSYHIMV